MSLSPPTVIGGAAVGPRPPASAGAAWADTLVSNLGQTTLDVAADVNTDTFSNVFTTRGADLNIDDFSQAFTTGATVDAYTYSGVKVKFATVPSATATVSAFIADGQGATDTIVANLTNPGTWSAVSTFGIPSGTTFAANTTYYLIIEATDGVLAETSSDNEDRGGVTGWSIANEWDRRQMESDTGLGGTWTDSFLSLQIAVEGDHKGTVTSCSAASMEHQVWTGTVTVGQSVATPRGYGSSYGSLDDTTFAFRSRNYTIDQAAVSPGALVVFSLGTTTTLGTDAADLVLHIGAQEYAVADAAYTASSNSYSWMTNIPTWNEYDRVCLALTELTPPGAPVLTAASKDMSIELTWTVEDHGTSDITKFEYRIKESTAASYPTTNEWTTIGIASNTGGSGTITGLTNDTTYNVQVRGVNTEGNGDNSNEITATPPGTVPSAPTNLHAKGVSATQIDLAWFAPSKTGGTAITGYKIEVSNTGTGSWSDLVASQTGTTYSHTVASGVTRYYRVSAINTAGASVASNVASATAEDTAPGGQFARVHPQHSGGAVELVFDESLDMSSAPDKSQFTVKVQGNNRTVPAAAVALRTVLVSVSPSVKPGETVTVSYTKPTGMGAMPLKDAGGSETASFTDFAVMNLLAATAPEAPGSLAATAVSGDGTKMDLAWTTPWHNGSDITKFQVRHEAGTSVSATTMWDDITGSGPTTTRHQVTGLSGDTEYTFEVRAVNGIGGGSEAAVTERTTDTTAPTLASASIGGVPGWLGLIYDEKLDRMSTPDKSAFTVKVEGATRSIAAVGVRDQDSEPGVMVLTLDSDVRPGETVTVSYTVPSTNPIQDLADNEAAAFTDFDVSNNLAATAPEAPGNLSAAPDPVSGTPPRVYADRMVLTWDTPWDNGDAITGYKVRHVEGSSAGGTFAAIAGSATSTISHTVTGLKPGTQYTFEVLAVNGQGDGTAATVTETTATPAWSFTLRDSSNTDVTELTEGGDAATATVSITNNVRFGAEQTVQIEWGGFDITVGHIQGTGGVSAITIPANGASGSLVISSPQRTGANYSPDQTHALTATHGDTEIGSIDLTRLDDEEPPVARITQAPTTVNEGDNIEIEVTLSVGYERPGAVKFTVEDTDGALSGTPPDREVLSAGVKELTVTLTAAENTTQNDGARDVTFTLGASTDVSTDIPYTLAPPPALTSVTVTVRDDDTPPLAPRNLTAQAGNTEATLRWDAPAAPTPDHGQPVLHYEYRVKVGTGSFGSWTRFPNSDADTRSHKFTGLTNGTEYTYEVAAVNVAGRGTEAQKSVTPLVGIAVSFGAAALSVDEGDDATVTVTLATAPAAGTTVTVPLTATPGTGLDSSEYSGVPMNVVFNAGDTSKSFTVTTVDDTDDEPDRLLTFSFGTLPEGYVPGTNSQLELTLVDDDVPIVSATFGRAAAEVQEGTSTTVTVSLSQAPEREVVLPIGATRGANLAADEVDGVPASVTFAVDETSKSFTVTFEDDAVVEGNETLTLTFGTFADSRVTQGANTRLVLTVTDDDGPPAAPDVSVQTGDGYAALSWAPVANDSPVLRYEVRWRETDGGTFNTWQQVGLVTSYRVEGLTNDKAYEFQVRAVNLHGADDDGIASAPGTPTERLTGIPKAVQVLQVKATDSSRAELSWTRPSNGTDRATRNSASAPFSQIQGYRIEVCRTTCGDEANWYALVPNTRAFQHKYVHQVLAPGVIRENRYRVQAININGKTGPWSNVATLEATVLERFWLVSPNSSTVDVHLEVWHPDGNPLYVRYQDTSDPMSVRYKQQRLTQRGYPVISLPVEASTHYRVEVDFVNTFDSPRLRTATVWSLQEGAEPYKSPYAKDLLDAEVWRGGQWRDAPDNELYLRMGETGKYRVRLKPCGSIYSVIPRRIQAPAGRLRASPTDFEPALFSNLNCKVVQDGWRTDADGNYVTMGDVYDMTNFQDRANDRIPIYAGTPNVWREVTVTARALEDYAADVRHDALLSAPFAVVYNHEVYYGSHDSRSGLVSEGTGLVRVSVDRPADAVLPVPTGVTIGSETRVMSWDAVSGASHYLVEWRYGPRYSNRANRDRSHRTATSVTLPLGGSGRGPITARVRAYSASAVSAWSAELTWDSRPPTLNVLDTAVNEDDGSVGFLVTLDPAATGTVTVDYATDDGTAVAGTDYTATSGTLTFAPGEREKKTDLVPIADDDEEDSGETFRLVLSNPTGSDANNGAAVLARRGGGGDDPEQRAGGGGADRVHAGGRGHERRPDGACGRRRRCGSAICWRRATASGRR